MLITLVCVLLVLFCPFGYLLFRYLRKKKYTEFMQEHSVALKQLKIINQHYHFFEVADFDEEHIYDNEICYDTVSCEDYLVYVLVNNEKGIRKAMKDCQTNIHLWREYEAEINETCIKNEYDTDSLPKNKKYLQNLESEILTDTLLKPTLFFSITIYLERRDMGNTYKESKTEVFEPKEISDLLRLINQKDGCFYRVKSIWDALCRVERGKVSNRMRFAIFRRDGERCKRCGSRHDLEIDHIVPISKGGKSTYDNLQTLCHSCNMEKGTDIERY